MHTRLPNPIRLLQAGLALLAVVCGMAGLLSALAAPARAQDPTTAPAVQPVPSREALELSGALSRLSRDPRNVDALVDAGIAASKLGDFEAAVGFFKRGQALAPSSARLLAGLAGALVRQGDAAAAIPLFSQATAAGIPMQAVAADRGLAHDLVGDPQGAQRYYAQALAAGVDVDEVTRRLAISQAIAGDGSAMEKTLLSLLKKQDKAAWRARAFGLAILGQDREASRIVKTLLPGSLANGITPYLQYMPRLTRAQQAAAANLGVFPRASEIGRDEARIAALSPSGSGRDAGKALVPAGRPLGSGTSAEDGTDAASPREQRRLAKEAEAKARREAKLAEEQRRRETRLALASSKQPRVAPPEPRPGREEGPQEAAGFAVARGTSLPPVAQVLEGRKVAETVTAPPEAPLAAATPVAAASPAAALPATSAAAAVVQAAPAAGPPAAPVAQVATATPPPTAPVPAALRPVAASGFDLARLPSSTGGAAASAPAQHLEAALAAVVAAPPPAPASVPSPVPAPAPSFGALFADLGKPTTAIDPAAGAVDLRKIKPARPLPKPKPEAEVKKTVPSHPSRIWVQLGIGQKLAALSQDWRKMEKAYPAEVKGRKPFTARLSQTNRLLTGPFASQKEAARFVDALVKAGAPRPLVWTSPAGEVVDDLSR